MTVEEMTREKQALRQLQNQLDDAYGAICALAGIVSQIPGVKEVDIKKALASGFSVMPRQIPASKRSNEVAELVAQNVVGRE